MIQKDSFFVLTGMNLQLNAALYSFLLLSFLFILGWYYCFTKKIFAWLDFFWSASFMVVIFIYHLTAYLTHQAINIRGIDILYLVWSIRLSSHLYTRIKKFGEDKRYISFRKKWKVWYGFNFFVLFQIEVLLTIILSIPLFITYNESIYWPNQVAIVIFTIAILGESIADYQLSKFIESTEDKTAVCNVGLWRYSRHPNYFFEWLIWISYAVYGISSSNPALTLIPGIIMYFMLTKVTGIPPAEASSLNSKKENFIKYQKQTNAFFPWFPKKLSIAVICGILSITVHASTGGSMEQQEKIKSAFTNLRADNVHILDDFYAQDTLFIDPVGRHEGRQAVKDYYQNLYQNVKSIKFDYKDLVTTGNTHVLVWTMTLSATGLNQGKPITLEGTSHIKFNEQGLVSYHRDYFDMGEFIYEHIPVLGWTVKKVKEKLKSK